MRTRPSPLCVEEDLSRTSPFSILLPSFVIPESLDITVVVLGRVGLVSHGT